MRLAEINEMTVGCCSITVHTTYIHWYTLFTQIVGDLSGILTAGVYDVMYSNKCQYAAIASGDKIHLCHVALPKKSSPFLTQLH